MGWGIREGPNEPITRCRPSTVIAFKLRGRLRVIVAMPSEMSTVTVVVIVVGRVRWRHNESEEGVETRKHILAGQPLRTGRIRHLSAPGIEIPKSGTVGLFLDQRRAETTRHLNTPPCRSFMKLCLQVQLTFTVDFSWISQKFHSTTAASIGRSKTPFSGKYFFREGNGEYSIYQMLLLIFVRIEWKVDVDLTSPVGNSHNLKMPISQLSNSRWIQSKWMDRDLPIIHNLKNPFRVEFGG